MILTENFEDSGLDMIAAIPTVPDYVSMYEWADYMNEATEVDFNQMYQNIGLQELGAFMESEGQEVVYEAVDFKKLKETIVDFFKKQWGRIQDLYKKFLDKMDENSKKFKEAILKTKGGKDGILKGAAKFEDGKTYYKGYDYTNVGLDMYETANKVFDTNYILTKIAQAAVPLQNMAKDADVVAEVDAAKKRIDNAMTLGTTKLTPEAVKDKVKEAIRGKSEAVEYKGSWVKKNAAEIYNYVVESSIIKKKTKKLLDADKKLIDTCIKEVKKSKDSEHYLRVASAGLKTLLALSNARRSAVMTCISERYSVYHALISKMGAARGDKATPKGVKESTTIQRENLESLWNWD